MIKLAVKTVYLCRCQHCNHEWEAEHKPLRCAACKYRSWNGEDRRSEKPDIFDGEKPPRLHIKPLADVLTKAQTVIGDIIAANPCEHPGNCVCAEKEILTDIGRQITHLNVFKGGWK